MTKSLLTSIILILFGFGLAAQPKENIKIRRWTDSCRFVGKAWQLDSFVRNIGRTQGEAYRNAKAISSGTGRNMWGLAICPHDAYRDVGYLYPAILSGVTAKHLLLIGTMDGSKDISITNRLIFDSFSHWQYPYGKIPVSDAREAIMHLLPDSSYCVNNSIHQDANALEALLPFIAYYGKGRDIIPILVAPSYNARLQQTAMDLADVLAKVLTARGWVWGRDFAIIITGNAVMYGEQEQAGISINPYGLDSAAHGMAMNYDYDLINTYLTGPMMPMKAGGLTLITTKKEDYRIVKWPWSGRFSIPFGLYTAYYFRKKSGNEVRGFLLGYETSLTTQIPIPGKEKECPLLPGLNKWTGHFAIGYR